MWLRPPFQVLLTILAILKHPEAKVWEFYVHWIIRVEPTGEGSVCHPSEVHTVQ